MCMLHSAFVNILLRTVIKNYVSSPIKKEKASYMSHQIKLNTNNPAKLWKNFADWNIDAKEYRRAKKFRYHSYIFVCGTSNHSMDE